MPVPHRNQPIADKSGMVDDHWHRFFDEIYTQSGTIRLPRFTVANLPTALGGEIAFATDGRKNGEGAGSGTGVLVFHDGTAWRACDTGATAAA